VYRTPNFDLRAALGTPGMAPVAIAA